MPEFKNPITKANIQTWEQDLQTLPRKIEQLHVDIHAYQAHIKQLEPKLQSVNAQIAPIDAVIESLDARIEIIESGRKINNLEPKIPPHQAIVDELTPQLVEVEKTLAPINDEINKLERVIRVKQHQLDIAEFQESMRRHQATLDLASGSHRIAKASLASCHAEIEQLRSQIRMLESQNSTDERTIWMNNIIGQPQPMPMAMPMGQPSPVAVCQPQPVAVGCYDQNSGLRSNIEMRRGQITQLNATIGIKQGAQSTYEKEVRRLKTEMDQSQYEINLLKNKLSSSESSLLSFSHQEKSWANSEEMSQLRVKLQQHQSIRAPHESKRNSLQSEISEHSSQVSMLKGSISTLKQRINDLTDTASNFADINDTADLKDRLGRQKDIKKPLSSERTRLTTEIEQENTNIRLTQADISAFETTLARHRANYFLINLREHPESAFENLAQAVRNQLAGYDYKHPANQSYNVRAYLNSFEQEILRIRNLALPVNQKSTNNQVSLLDNPAVMKYFILCGSFYRMVENISHERNTSFASLVREALKNTPIDPKLCMDMYAPYQAIPISEAQLNNAEQKRYEAARQAFSTTLSTIPKHDKKFKKLHDLGEDIMKKVDLRKSNDIDLKHATLILENSNNLALFPHDVGFQENQKSLASYIPEDKPGAKKKCWGILLMFLGAAIAIGSGVACIVSPFATIGVGAGVVTMIAGVGLFRSGRKDLTRAMNNYERMTHDMGDNNTNPPPYVTPASNMPESSASVLDTGIFTKLR